ncbi:tetratricopeptide repeat protein [Sphingomonas sp. GCM10030256]|uniref:tetratricopeptide repeat protein n=1 Tax=Sphingomonas sp. GCM10030256 TaxID=3273427 RepID=UPI003609E7DE
MALAPGETNESFIREVDENLRRSQAEDFFKRYGGWLIAAAVLVLALAAGILYWRNHQVEVAQGQSEALAQVITDIGNGKTGNADARLAAMAKNAPDAYRGAALLSQAALALQSGNRTKAADAYRAVSQDDDLPEGLRQAALVRGTAVEFDTLKPEEVVSRLQELAKPGNPWFGSAGELSAMAMLKQNRTAEAGRLFAAIGNDKTAPASLRGRAQQIAGSLGVEPASPPAPRT